MTPPLSGKFEGWRAWACSFAFILMFSGIILTALGIVLGRDPQVLGTLFGFSGVFFAVFLIAIDRVEGSS